MKKTIFTIIVFIAVFSVSLNVKAYTTSQYSFQEAEGYEEVSEGNLTKEDGSNINIQVKIYEGEAVNEKIFSEKNLNDFVEELYTETDKYREEIKITLKEQYGEYLSDEDIEEYVKSFKCNEIVKKEITMCTKNNYKCFHIIANYTLNDFSYYVDQYSIFSGNEIYTLTISGENLEDLNLLEKRMMIESFTITNYQAPQKELLTFDLSKVTTGINVAIIAIAIMTAIVINKNKKSKKE